VSRHRESFGAGGAAPPPHGRRPDTHIRRAGRGGALSFPSNRGGFPYAGVSLAAERIWSLTERGSRATSGAWAPRRPGRRRYASPSSPTPRCCGRRPTSAMRSTRRGAPDPAQHDPINFYGTCSFDVETELRREGHRPLTHQPPHLLAAGRRDQIRSAAKATPYGPASARAATTRTAPASWPATKPVAPPPRLPRRQPELSSCIGQGSLARL